jgi:hypothetical protein
VTFMRSIVHRRGFTMLWLAAAGAVFISGCASKGPVTPPESVELRFMPKPPGQDNGAVWSMLTPFINGDIATQGQVGMGEWFPVAEPDGPELFEVHLVSGDDTAVIVEARTAKNTQRVSIEKGGIISCEIAGGEYEFLYPHRWIGKSSLPTTGTTGMNELTPQGHVSKIGLIVRRKQTDKK